MTGAIARVRDRIRRIRLFSVRDMMWQYAASFGVAIFGAIFVLAAGRILGPEDFGIYAIAAAVPTVVNALFDYRIQEVSIVVLSEKAEPVDAARNARSLFLFDILARLVAFAISVVGGIVVIGALGFTVDPTVPLFAALGILFAKAGNGIAIGLMRLSGRIHNYALLQSADWALRLAGLSAVYLWGSLTIESAFLVQLPPALIINLWILRLARGISRRTYGAAGDVGRIAHLFALCRRRSGLLLSSQAISAVDSVVKELDTLICGIFLSAHNVAIYKIAKNIALVAWKCVDPIFVVILPNVANYVSEGKMDELSAILKNATFYLFLVSIVVFFGVWAVSYPLTRFALGSSYADVPSIIPFISLWIVAALPFIWAHSVAIASGHASLQAFAGFLGAIAGVGALLLGAAAWGIYGAALGLSVAYAAGFVISCALLLKKGVVRW